MIIEMIVVTATIIVYCIALLNMRAFVNVIAKHGWLNIVLMG